MAVSDPEVIVFANERARVMANVRVQDYNTAKRFKLEADTRGMFSLHIPQLTDQKCTSVGCPFACSAAAAPVALNHSVAPSNAGISVPILIGMTGTSKEVMSDE